MSKFIFATGLLLSFAANSAELVLKPVKIAPDIYAVIGDLGNQTFENEGLNSNLGFVVTGDGVLVINTGPSMRVARALQIAIGKITAQPVKWGVNLNSQNHYWLGNGHLNRGALRSWHTKKLTRSCAKSARRNLPAARDYL